MNKLLAEHFNAFSYTRLNQVELSLDDNNEYQKALNTLDKTKDNPVDVALAAINIAEIAAYKQGFIDGLTLIAGFGA